MGHITPALDIVPIVESCRSHTEFRVLVSEQKFQTLLLASLDDLNCQEVLLEDAELQLPVRLFLAPLRL